MMDSCFNNTNDSLYGGDSDNSSSIWTTDDSDATSMGIRSERGGAFDSTICTFNNALNLADHIDVWNNPSSFDPTSFQDAGQHDPSLFMTQGPAYNSEQRPNYTHDGLPMWGDTNAAGYTTSMAPLDATFDAPHAENPSAQFTIPQPPSSPPSQPSLFPFASENPQPPTYIDPCSRTPPVPGPSNPRRCSHTPPMAGPSKRGRRGGKFQYAPRQSPLNSSKASTSLRRSTKSRSSKKSKMGKKKKGDDDNGSDIDNDNDNELDGVEYLPAKARGLLDQFVKRHSDDCWGDVAHRIAREVHNLVMKSLFIKWNMSFLDDIIADAIAKYKVDHADHPDDLTPDSELKKDLHELIKGLTGWARSKHKTKAMRILFRSKSQSGRKVAPNYDIIEFPVTEAEVAHNKRIGGIIENFSDPRLQRLIRALGFGRKRKSRGNDPVGYDWPGSVPGYVVPYAAALVYHCIDMFRTGRKVSMELIPCNLETTYAAIKGCYDEVADDPALQSMLTHIFDEETSRSPSTISTNHTWLVNRCAKVRSLLPDRLPNLPYHAFAKHALARNFPVGVCKWLWLVAGEFP
ncbi:hypothetical protein PILCRDRAFT_93625 [Piloderma croceum F 1598]|uniref:Uncharacterized protein n=1 Tax=Piloderma croceum (strain F 1598) TaxID=765440 RepID=A0A0C3EH88_PILCF|nr:hypothetical protein PILCRDRAFT_93625 [Piloderma croceum F 1598]